MTGQEIVAELETLEWAFDRMMEAIHNERDDAEFHVHEFRRRLHIATVELRVMQEGWEKFKPFLS